MIVLLTVVSQDRKTGAQTGEPRVEKIDTNRGCLYDHCRTTDQVKKAYETFFDLDTMSKDVVRVIEAREG